VLLRRSLRRRRVAAREFREPWRRALERYVRYYMVLSPEDRARFERDVAVFIDDAEITGVNTTVTDDVRVLVASSAVMLVFGRPSQRLIERELVRARRGESALDEYARTNEVELFAVAVESFFKDPRRLRARHGELYDALREYLNQDPAGRP